MAALTLPGVLLTGDHASRPAATAVANGALYACSTHGTIYQSDGATWSTWRASTAVADILDLATAETDDTLVLAPDGAGGVEFRAEAEGGGGGGNVATPVVLQRKIVTTDATSLTITAVPSGNRMVVSVSGSNASATALSCTNTTFTKVADFTAADGSHCTVWVGVVSGGSSGTSISVTTTATFTNIGMVEVTDALTPTAGTVRSASRGSSVSDLLLDGLTAGRFIAIATCNGNAGNAIIVKPTFPYVWGVVGRVGIHVAYAPTGTMTFDFQSGTSQSGGLVVVDIT